MDFLGRIDHQVKLRGLRIELGEIEAVLARQPAVAQAVVTVREGSLVAHFVPHPQGAEPDLSDLRVTLRDVLRRELPEYMVPAWFVPLPAFPLTSSGKVDRKALPAPDGSRAGREYVAPEGEAQEQMAAIWTEVLRLKEGRRVGANDNFFELGGHSLMATQVLSRVQKAFGVELPLRAMFDTPTVAGLAEAVIQKSLEKADTDLLAQLLAELEG